MATYRKRGDRYQAIVRVNGIHEYRSFNNKGGIDTLIGAIARVNGLREDCSLNPTGEPNPCAAARELVIVNANSGACYSLL